MYLLHCALARCVAVYCNWSCLWPGLCVWLCVCGSVTMITQNCAHRSSPNGFVGKGSGHLQLSKFWPSRAPGKRVCGGAKNFGFALLQPTRSVCVSLSAFFIRFCATVARNVSINDVVEWKEVGLIQASSSSANAVRQIGQSQMGLILIRIWILVMGYRWKR